MLTEERKGQIALAIAKRQFRKDVAFRDIINIKRSIGNVIKEPEFVTIEVTAEECLELFKELLEEVFEDQLRAI
jgi:hypothetical protein